MTCDWYDATFSRDLEFAQDVWATIDHLSQEVTPDPATLDNPDTEGVQ